jgi:hypothetical protein
VKSNQLLNETPPCLLPFPSKFNAQVGCLAYRDRAGAWVDYHTGKPLAGEIHLIEYSED